jgi:hypothetical protein
MDSRINITIPKLNKLILNSISGLLLGSIGVLFIHQNSISNIFNYIVISYIFIILIIGSTISLLEENIIVIKKYSLFVFWILFYNIFISFLLILFLIAVFISNNLNDIIIILFMTFFSLLESFLYSVFNIKKVYIFYKSQDYNESNRLLN